MSPAVPLKKIAMWIRFGLELKISIMSSTQSTINLIKKIIENKFFRYHGHVKSINLVERHSVTGCSTEKKIAIWIRFGLELILLITNSTQSTINLIRKIIPHKKFLVSRSR